MSADPCMSDLKAEIEYEIKLYDKNVKEKNQLQGGPMAELQGMTTAQMIAARPDLVKLMLDGLKELEEKEQKPTC